MTTNIPVPSTEHTDEGKPASGEHGETKDTSQESAGKVIEFQKRVDELLKGVFKRKDAVHDYEKDSDDVAWEKMRLRLNQKDSHDLLLAASQVASAEGKAAEAQKELLLAASERESAETVKKMSIANDNKIRALTEFNTIAEGARKTILSEPDDGPLSSTLKKIREYGVPLGGGLGLGIASAIRYFGAEGASTFLSSLANPATFLGKYTYGGGLLGSVALGGWLGGKIEQKIRQSSGRTSGKGTIGKILGSVASAAGATFAWPSLFAVSLASPSILPSAAVAGGMYGAYKLYRLWRSSRFRSTPAYKNAELLRNLDLNTLVKPEKMQITVLGKHALVTYEEKTATVDVSEALSSADVRAKVQTGINKLTEEVEKKQKEKEEKHYRQFLKGVSLPVGVTLNFAEAHHHKITIEYTPQTAPSTMVPKTLDCKGYPEDADAFATMFKNEMSEFIRNTDESSDEYKAKQFITLLKDYSPPDGIVITFEHAKGLKATLKFRKSDGTFATPSHSVECSNVPKESVLTIVKNAANAYKKEQEDKELGALGLFKLAIREIDRVPNMRVDMSEAKDDDWKLTLKYFGKDSPTINCNKMQTTLLKSFVNEEIQRFKEEIDNDRDAEFAKALDEAREETGVVMMEPASTRLQVNLQEHIYSKLVNCEKTPTDDFEAFLISSAKAFNRYVIHQSYTDLVKFVGTCSHPLDVHLKVDDPGTRIVHATRSGKSIDTPLTADFQETQIHAKIASALDREGWTKKAGDYFQTF